MKDLERFNWHNKNDAVIGREIFTAIFTRQVEFLPNFTMESYVAPNSASATQKPGYEEQTEAVVYRIRITLTSKNVKALEKVCADLIHRSKEKSLQVKGPVRLPTKTLRIVTAPIFRS